MKITKTHTPGAILPEDREGRVVVNGKGTIMFCRDDCLIYLEGVSGFDIYWMTIIGLPGKWRLLRFLKAIPHLWRFCK